MANQQTLAQYCVNSARLRRKARSRADPHPHLADAAVGPGIVGDPPQPHGPRPRRVAKAVQLPVGVVTMSVGGAYLVWLLVREARK